MGAVPRTSNLKRSTDALYEAFVRYPAVRQAEDCLHCASDANWAAASNRPIRQLSADDLLDFATNALVSWGDVVELKHFLPRLLELSATGELGVDPEALFYKLTLAKWRAWLAPEVAAIDRWLRAYWQAVLTDAPLLAGLRIQLERTKDVPCGVCGQTVVVVGKAAGPHVASLHCASCDRHRGWLPKTIADFLGQPKPSRSAIRNSRKRMRPRFGCTRGRNVSTLNP
jgi:hypothetical protein